MDKSISDAARAMRASQFVGLSADEVSAEMSRRAEMRMRKISPAKRRKIAAAGGRAGKGVSRSGRPRKAVAPPADALPSEPAGE